VDAQQERLYEAREGIGRTGLATIEQAQPAAITDFAGVKADATRWARRARRPPGSR
jgi:hypothetical protein